jgi:formylglycine-generating enzyme required for sulfatase activity
MKALMFALFLCVTSSLNAATLCSDLLAGSARIDGTDALIAYISNLLAEKILSDEELSHFVDNLEKGQIVNPISSEKAWNSKDSLIHQEGIDEVITDTRLDQMHLLEWARRIQQERSKAQSRRDETRIVTEGIFQKMKFVPIPAGTFMMMGLRGKELRINLKHPYEVMSTPVTQKQWVEVMGENPSHFVDGEQTITITVNGKPIKMQPNNPLESITWYSAAEFCNRMSISAGLEPTYDFSDVRFASGTRAENGTLSAEYQAYKNIKINAQDENIYLAKGFRLPTLEESQNVIKAASNKSVLLNIEKHGWLYSNSLLQTHPVAELEPVVIAGQAIYDTIGNVWEWNHNSKGFYARSDTQSDPRDNNKRCVSGWCWRSEDIFHPTVHSLYESDIARTVGFRPVRTLP